MINNCDNNVIELAVNFKIAMKIQHFLSLGRSKVNVSIYFDTIVYMTLVLRGKTPHSEIDAKNPLLPMLTKSSYSFLLPIISETVAEFSLLTSSLIPINYS